MKNKGNLSQDELRQKIDGFSLDNKDKNIEEDKYITTDQCVYYPPDDTYDDAKKILSLINKSLKHHVSHYSSILLCKMTVYKNSGHPVNDFKTDNSIENNSNYKRAAILTLLFFAILVNLQPPVENKLFFARSS